MVINRFALVLTFCLVFAACSRPSFNKGVDAFNAKDYPAALAQWKPLADSGDARAQANVGTIYLQGLGVAQDVAQAVHWYTLAAAQGHPDAEANLGVLYMNGQGVPRDLALARSWFTKAAAQDQHVAAFNLGVLYDNGQGGPVDKAKAAEYYTQAANLGDPQGQENLGADYATGDGVAADKVQAYRWLSLGSRGEADPQQKTEVDANLARLKSGMTPEQIAQGDAAVAAFKPKPH